MKQENMTPRERWMAAIRLEPLDRLPFWPKIFEAYPRAQRAPFCHMSVDAIHDWVGSDQHISLPPCYKEIKTRTSIETVTKGHLRKTTYRTPYGLMEGTSQFDVESQSWHPVQFPVRSRDDIGLMTEIYADCRGELDAEALQEVGARVRQIGDSATTWSVIGESPLMHWVEYEAGIENAHFFLSDYTTEVEALFEAHHQVLLRRADIMAASAPTDVVYMVENTSTTLISPEQYRRYCKRHINEYGTIVREAGRLLVLHMCGHLKALLPDLAAMPAQAFEAFTTPTLGDTTLLDGRAACPDKCLVGGTNAILWTRSAGEIIETIEQELAALPHHRGLVITSAGVMPPLCAPETIKAVADWVKSYPLRL